MQNKIQQKQKEEDMDWGRSDRKVFYARAGLAALLLLTIVLILRSCISKKARRDAGGCGCVQTGD